MLDKQVRIYNSRSSECFGDTGGIAAMELTPFHPRSPYAVGKSSAFWLVDNYREAYKLFVCTGILFNHESPYRPPRFVTQKIISTAKRIVNGSIEKLISGWLDISRDWGRAPEYVEAMWLMLQQDKAEDFVISTGELNSLEDFVDTVFCQLGLNWKEHVVSNEEFMRPTDLAISFGDPSKAKKILGWQAQYKMRDVVSMMMV
ncbi:MAG: GDPmannose 4,6-dehydratase [Psychroserpens sp.]|jgi:GDPmannose 4,6-dehydratase